MTQLAKLSATILAASATIAQAEQSKLKLNEENAHIQYCLDLLQVDRPMTTQSVTSIFQNTKPTPLRVILLGFFDENTPMSVADVVKKAAPFVTTTRGTINTTLFEMVKKGALEKVSLGVYKKASQSETPAVTGVSGVTESESSIL